MSPKPENKFRWWNPETYNERQQVTAMILCAGLIVIIAASRACQFLGN